MMDNFARIISHGFAIVVVILLGIGFIYRGELFPDLELPDFLVPSSERMADAGDHMDKRQPEMAVTQGKTADEPAEAASAPIAPIVETPATVSEATPTVVTDEAVGAKPATQETEESGIVAGTVVEPLQAPAEEISPPPAEEPEPAESASAAIGETSTATATESLPAPVVSEETPVEPQVEVPGSGVTAQPAAVAEETSPVPGIPPEAVPQTGSRTSVEGENSYPVPAPREGPAPTTGMAVPGSVPVTAAEMQPGVSAAGQSTGVVTTAVKPYELLAAAREAFWLHNYDDAEKNYRALTELEPQNPDGYGELGNMYFSQGRWEDAAAAYYEAGTRLISEGRLDPARELVTVIRGLNGQQADELSKLITSAASAGNH
jgi:hypothetical protein